jgi:hypothetical protein
MVDDANGRDCPGPAATVRVGGGGRAEGALNGARYRGGLTAVPYTELISSRGCILVCVRASGETAEALGTLVEAKFGVKGSGVAYAALAFDDSAIGVEAELVDGLDSLLYLMRHWEPRLVSVLIQQRRIAYTGTSLAIANLPADSFPRLSHHTNKLDQHPVFVFAPNILAFPAAQDRFPPLTTLVVRPPLHELCNLHPFTLA